MPEVEVVVLMCELKTASDHFGKRVFELQYITLLVAADLMLSSL
jgi:hypothetical protein